MGHFVHAARFHYGEQIRALGRETNNRDEHNVWLGKKRDKAVWRMAASDKAGSAEQFTGMGWDGTAHSSLHGGAEHLTLFIERLFHTILLLSEMTENTLHVNHKELGDYQSKCMSL